MSWRLSNIAFWFSQWWPIIIQSVQLNFPTWKKLVMLLLMPWPKLPFNLFRLIAIVSRYTSTLVQVMAWCRAYLSAKYLAWPQCIAYFNNLGHFSVFFFFSAMVNQHLTCVNECPFALHTMWIHTCISAFFSWKNARAYICTFLEHHFTDDGPFQSVQQWFSWKHISKYS